MQDPKLFLVDDSTGDGILLDLAFTESGRSVKIVQAHDGVEAFELLRAAAGQRPFPFRLIVIDLHLPRMDGLELLLGLKGWPELSRVPMVILTTASTVLERERIENCHSALLMKPNDYSGLAVIVAELAAYMCTCEQPMQKCRWLANQRIALPIPA